MVDRNRGMASLKFSILALGEAVIEGRSHLNQLSPDRHSGQGIICYAPCQVLRAPGLHWSFGKLTLAPTLSLPYRSSQTRRVELQRREDIFGDLAGSFLKDKY